MKATYQLTLGLSFAALCSFWMSTRMHAQSDLDVPTFRPRTDFNAKRDLQLLREALNRAGDVNGAINPLGEYIERNSEVVQAEMKSRLEIGQSEKEADKVEKEADKVDKEADKVDKEVDKVDKEAEEKPKIEPRKSKQVVPSKPSTAKQSPSIAILPGPHYTIIQPASPQYSRTIVDTFRPVSQYPVSLATNSYIANLQDIPSFAPGGSATSGVFPPSVSGGFAPSTFPGLTTNSQPTVPDATVAPVYPYNPGPIANPNPTNLVPYNPPLVNQPVPQPYFPSQPGIAGASPLRSPSDAMPSYSRQQPPMVNGLPFVNGAPCRYDASSMVSRDVYRQSVDPCAPTRCSPIGYAPYATQPGGGPFSYIPPTYMPNNNGNNSGYRPLIGFGQSLDNAYLGRGIIGQPMAYVDGQPVRNFIRYLFP